MDVASYAGLLTDYTEIRLQQNTSRVVGLVNGNVVRNTHATKGGASARVWQDGVWGFASDPLTERDGVERVVQTAQENARYLAGRGVRSLGQLPEPEAARGTHRFPTDRGRWSTTEVVTFLEELDAWIAATFPALHARRVMVATLDMEKSLLTSSGSEAHSLTPRTNLIISCSMVKDGEPFALTEVHGGFGQLEDRIETVDAWKEAITVQMEHLAHKTEAVRASAGRHVCVLDADLAGILAHEAIGHTTEADLVLGGSVAGDQLGHQVASPLISLTDFAHTAFGESLPVPVHIDDEGTPSVDAEIIVEGQLQQFMHSKETALRMEHSPTGNARAFAFDDEPLVRMRNTSFVPGTSKLEEMIAAVDDGYYLMRSSNGQADSTSEFTFGIVLGYEIKGGKLGRAIRDTTVSGVAFDVLKTVTAVSDDLTWKSSGMCGKKQWIPVGMGGPAIACTISVGGA